MEWHCDLIDAYSDFITVSFDLSITYVTPSCISPGNLMVGNETATSADLSWNIEATAVNGYEWIVVAAGDGSAPK